MPNPGPGGRGARSGRPPDILWIVTTQWRGQAIGYAGDPNAHTPCLDALAAEAVNFAQAVTPHPFGPFARAALLTGVRSPENGVRDYFDPLPRQARTVAHRLKDRGYVTAFFGKWHLYRRDPDLPVVGDAHARIVVPPDWRGGFDFWEGFESGFLVNDPWLHGTRLARPEQFPGYQSDVLCDRAAHWIADFGYRRPEADERQAESGDRRLETGIAGAETDPIQCPSPSAARLPASAFRNPGRPWFVVVSVEPPHPPYDAPAAGMTPQDPHRIRLAANVPRGGGTENQARKELAGYYAHLEATDRAIGRLLSGVSRDNTIVVFTSVHGDMHGAHGLFRKGWPYEESIRVPLLVRGARLDAGGSWMLDAGRGGTRDDPVSLVDLPRWTLAWAGERSPLAPRRGLEAQNISMPCVVRLPRQCDRIWRGVRTARRKVVLNADGSPWLCFHLDEDPGEERNLAPDAAAIAEMAALLREG